MDTASVETFSEFINHHTADEWERFLVWLVLMGLVYFMILREDTPFKTGFKGSDKMWQGAEAIVYIFIYMIPGIVLTNFLLEYKIDDQAMWIIELILLTALGIRAGIDGIKTWKNGHPKPPEDAKPQQ